MDLSVVLLVCCSVALILGLVFCFFGYKLARLLFPLGGVVVIEGLLYIYVFGLFRLDALGTWLFFVGSGVAFYIILFFIRRAAGFFTGLLGSALFLIFIVNAFGLQNLTFLFPICMTVCLVSGLLTVTYEKRAVIVFTSLFGACAAAFAGLYIYIQGVGTDYILSSGLFAAFQKFLSSNALLITAASAGVAVSGILVQIAVTSSARVLPGKSDEEDSFKIIQSVAADNTLPQSGNAPGQNGLDGEY